MAENNKDTVIPDKESTKKFLIIYCIAIFVFAVALISIAAFAQKRIERDAAALVAKAENAEDLAADKATLLDGVMTENTRLTAEIERLTDLAADKSTLLNNATEESEKLKAENEVLKAENAKLTETNTALSASFSTVEQQHRASIALTEIVNYRRTGEKNARKEAVEAFEANGYYELLTPEEQEIYNSVK